MTFLHRNATLQEALQYLYPELSTTVFTRVAEPEPPRSRFLPGAGDARAKKEPEPPKWGGSATLFILSRAYTIEYMAPVQWLSVYVFNPCCTSSTGTGTGICSNLAFFEIQNSWVH